MKIGKAFLDDKRGGWVVHYSGAESPPMRGQLTEPVLTRRGFCGFRLATKAERDAALARLLSKTGAVAGLLACVLCCLMGCATAPTVAPCKRDVEVRCYEIISERPLHVLCGVVDNVEQCAAPADETCESGGWHR